jgi:hypothetical protein
LTGAEKLLRVTLPTRSKQIAYHWALERYFAERGTPLKIYWLMGRWEMKWLRK